MLQFSPWENEIEQQFRQSEIRAGVQFRTGATLFRKQTNWIRPAPRASGLRQKYKYKYILKCFARP
jgi:hypothetical protein